MPPALTLYRCQKRGKQTPCDMWLHALPDLKAEFERISSSEDAPAAILLDGFPRALSHAQAAKQTFGYTFPDIAISLNALNSSARRACLLAVVAMTTPQFTREGSLASPKKVRKLSNTTRTWAV